MESRQATAFDQLDWEWDRLLATRVLDDHLIDWRCREVALETFTAPSEIVTLLADKSGDPECQSDVLLALLRIGRADGLANRLILQRFVPVMKIVAAWSQPFPQCDWNARVLSAAHEVIATYPIEHRPERVAANIAWDIRKRLLAELTDHRRCQAELAPAVSEEDLLLPDPAEGVEIVEVLRWARWRSGMPSETAHLIALSRIVGFTLEEIAATRRIPSARLRQRRLRGERRLRELIRAA